MQNRYTPEIAFIGIVIALSLAGFSSLAMGENAGLTGYRALHIVTSLAWLSLLLYQLLLLRRQSFRSHRTIGKAIFVVGPVLLATLTLLTVHSAAKEAATGEADMLIVQNVTFTLEVAVLVFLAFLLRSYREVHGALLMSTALMFLVIALFFTLISYVPAYQISGPETFSRFGEAAQMGSMVCSVIGLLFFLRSWRTGWPWLLTTAFFFLNGYLIVLVEKRGSAMQLTQLVASIGRVPAFAVGLTGFLALLWLAYRVGPKRGATR